MIILLFRISLLVPLTFISNVSFGICLVIVLLFQISLLIPWTFISNISFGICLMIILFINFMIGFRFDLLRINSKFGNNVWFELRIFSFEFGLYLGSNVWFELRIVSFEFGFYLLWINSKFGSSVWFKFWLFSFISLLNCSYSRLFSFNEF